MTSRGLIIVYERRMKQKSSRWKWLSLLGRRTSLVPTLTVSLSPVSNIIHMQLRHLIGSLDVTLQQVRLLMAEEEKEKVEAGTDVTHDVSASAFLLLGMDIQGLQQVRSIAQAFAFTDHLARKALRLDVKGKQKQTLLQKTSVMERRTVLLRRIQRFREIQQVYMPGFDPKNNTHVEHTASSDPSRSTHVEDCKLYMPSDLSNADRRKYCPGRLPSMEDRLRHAEASDSLENLRHQLRTRSFTNRFKIANVTGQIHNTRARETQHRIDDKVHAAELQYCH